QIEDEISPTFLSSVRSFTPQDPTLREIYLATTSQVTTPKRKVLLTHFHLRDGILWYSGSRLVVPEKLRLDLLHDYHDSVISGHPSKNYTYELLARWFYWPSMDKDIAKYIKSCDACQRMKDANRRSYGLLNLLSIPERPWSSILMDFITHLPCTDAGV